MITSVNGDVKKLLTAAHHSVGLLLMTQPVLLKTQIVLLNTQPVLLKTQPVLLVATRQLRRVWPGPAGALVNA